MKVYIYIYIYMSQKIALCGVIPRCWPVFHIDIYIYIYIYMGVRHNAGGLLAAWGVDNPIYGAAPLRPTNRNRK